ncbi:uncharacterized protein BDR25DRAFT_251125 [Lindgomyces ingoldianus]|uniref:Uncharacterized protein n=1 Tax=Lindgomyces ingoldianus TaxID=673940 RepID=A0ACB6RHV8_9PLEO|nr:uncharacterized protein BDR25DRAFT_251125 [Lindgomyces ingoldianus]KAF2478358.1 hypothetical protein BDR25DRAFT_251125 [Lindgomyces ingoldianus]
MVRFESHSLASLVIFACLSFLSSANDLNPSSECDSAAQITVLVTETVYGSMGEATHEPSPYGYSVHSAAVSEHPFPIPSEYSSCFDRSNKPYEYTYSSGYHFSGETKCTKTTSVTKTGNSYAHSTPIYGMHNTTLSGIYPTGTGPPKNSTNPTPAPCEPKIQLKGVSEYTFNKKNSPFSIDIVSCSKFNQNQTAAFANFEPVVEGITVSPDRVSFTGFSKDYLLLSIFALDTYGSPIIKSYELHFGSVDMPILVLNPDDSPASGVHVEANATIYPGLTGSCTTDASGKCTLPNLPGTTISLVARTGDNSIAVNGVAPTAVQVTLKLIPYITPKPGASLEVANGTEGWTGGTLQQSVKIKRDTTLVVNTNGQFLIQKASNSFPVRPSTKNVYIKYRFITSEVPGGFFGTQFNDYYSITIRSDTGAFVTITNSMNALGLGAFDASGATDIFTLSLQVPTNTKSVSYDIGVSNVADNLYDSSLVVEKVGDADCDKCGDCESCPTDPMCQPSCKNPPPKSCDFYTTCAEAQLGCGAEGYPVRYGRKNCLAFDRNRAFFTPAGQSFIWGTMSCLQRALVPALETCKESCDSLAAKAFASHAGCYVDNGFCGLGCGDILAVLITVNTDLVSKESGSQVLDTMGLCIGKALETLTGCTGEVAFGAVMGLTAEVSVPLAIAVTVATRYLGSIAAGLI